MTTPEVVGTGTVKDPWMLNTPPQSTEDATFRVLGLVWAGAPRTEVDVAAGDLRKLQRAGGGWAQLPAYPPNAYSTGEALYALREAGAAPDIRKGHPVPAAAEERAGGDL